MNISILYPDFTRYDSEKKLFGSFHFGIAAISAVMKHLGHKVTLFHFTSMPTKEEFISNLEKSKPDLICLSFTEENLEEVKIWYEYLNQNFSNVPNLAGGTYPTLFPEGALEIDGADMVCIGEGEIPLTELLQKMGNKEKYDDVLSLWVKQKNGEIVKNPIAPLQIDLDKFPKLDVRLFDHSSLETSNSNLKRLYFKASRGCPFNCSYCASPAIRKIYPNKERYVRFYSPKRTIGIIEELIELNPGVKSVQFADDILPYRIEWFNEFAHCYKEKINLPYRCYIHLGLINLEVVNLLKYSGCYRVNCGIESANPRILKDAYNRGVKKEKMAEGLYLLKKAGLQIHGSNIIGYYDETMDEILNTIKFNASHPVDIPIVSILNPYNGTKLNNDLALKGCLKNDIHYLNRGSRVKLKYLTESQLQFAFSTFRFMVLLYRTIYRTPKQIRRRLERTVDYFYTLRIWPYNLLNGIHDKYMNEFILTRIYRKLEKDLRQKQ